MILFPTFLMILFLNGKRCTMHQFSLHIYNYTRNKVVEVLRISTALLRILEKNMAPLECL
jgi:hypothetical protein